ncbi:MAG: TonB-dependent receptor [Raineya sp.]
MQWGATSKKRTYLKIYQNQKKLNTFSLLCIKLMSSSYFKIFLSFIFFSPPIFTFAQTIKGQIKNQKGEKILSANVIIRDSLGADDIREFVIARNGEYSITLQEKYERFILEVTANAYTKEFVELGNLDKNTTYIRDFVLIAESEQIEQITITAKKNPFSINKDTTKFDVQGYSDGTERKIEDIIKKLPGVQVNEKTGEIKYKNKSIETIKLDGDDLFGANYSIGSRNINVSMVEQIQAIENYSDNPLLKGVENSDKVILNLKLKKGIDVSGDIDFGNGLMVDKKFARDVGGTILAVTKSYKSFGSLSYNNIGINQTPFNYFDSYNYNPEQAKDKDFFAQKLIPEYGFSSVLEERRVNINQTLFGSYNQTFKLGSKINVKSGLYYISDNIQSLQEFVNNIQTANQNIQTSDLNNISKQPVSYSGDTQIKINTSSSSLLEYKFSFKQENIFTRTNLIQNNLKRFETELHSKDFYFKQNLTFTQKLAEQKALQILFNQASDKNSQFFSFNPAVFRPDEHQQEWQNTRSNKSTLEAKAILLGKMNKQNYTFSIGTNRATSPISSNFKAILGDNSAKDLEEFRNDFTYQANRFFNEATYRFFIKRWRFTLLHSVSFLEQSLISNLQEQKKSKKSFLLEPSLNLFRKLSTISSLSFSYNYTQKPFSEEYFFINPIFQSIRQTSRNTPELQFAKKHSTSLNYTINDLYNQFLLILGTNYNIMQGNYFSDLSIEPTRTQITFFFLPQHTNSLNTYLDTEKFFYKALILLKFNANYTFQTYNNIVNSSELRGNEMQVFSSKFEIKTGFKIKINFQNSVSYSRMSARNIGSNSFINENISNSFSLIYKNSKNAYFSFVADYFLPNIANTKENYWFFDANYSLTVPKTKYTIDLILKNIFNTANFQQVSTSDFATNVFRSNLLPRYGMVRVSCSF